jgi:transglutaminase-like putative cysteine protease
VTGRGSVPRLPPTLIDGFGNTCHVIHAPAGRLELSADFMIRDTGVPDEVAADAEQHPLEKLPVETLVYLLGSRYCETDRFIQIAWAEFGKVRKGWPLVQAICDYVNDRLKFGYEHASPTKTAWDAYSERQGVCRDLAAAFNPRAEDEGAAEYATKITNEGPLSWVSAATGSAACWSLPR